MAPVGEVSPDGQWFWDGQKWVTTVSADGAWRWNGTTWVASEGIASTSGSGRTGLPKRVPSRGGLATVGYLVAGAIVLVAIAAILAAVFGTNPGVQPAALLVSPSPSQTSGHSPFPSPIASASPARTPTPKASPSSRPASVASPRPKPVPSPIPKPPPVKSTCGAPANPWGYNFCGGSYITSPASAFCSYFKCIASFWKSTLGYVDECRDGTYSHSGGRQGACSYHGGELRPLYRP